MSAVPKLLALLVMVPSCATAVPPAEADRARSLAELHPCDAGPAQRLVGRRATARLLAAARRLSGASSIRLVRPGEPISMDYSTDRLTIEVDERNRLLRLSCG